MAYIYEIKFKDGERAVAESEFDPKSYHKRIIGREFIVIGKKIKKTSEIVGIYEKGKV